MSDKLLWSVVTSEHVADCRVFRVMKNFSRNEGRKLGQTFDFYIIKPNNWINIIPVTANGEVVLVKQFRHGIGSVTLEVPGGMIDDGEDPALAAARELLEETGFTSDPIVPLGINHPNPALQDNICHSFLAPNARQIQEPVFDFTEDIEIVLVPLSEIPNMIQKGEITHALVITAFHMLGLAQVDSMADPK